MKLIGSLLVTICLVIGTLAATTAYLVPIDRIDPDRDVMILHAPAGRIVDEDDPTARPRPVLTPGTAERPVVLGEEQLALLREAGVDRLHVKQFSLRHWRENWIFALACIGLLIGSIGVRTAIRRELTEAAGTTDREVVSPEKLLDDALDTARGLQQELRGMTDPQAKLQRIMRRIEVMQDECFEPFVFGRALIINRLGMGGYAQLMDRFAAAERQFNRAWSAAADANLAEALFCLDEAVPILEIARERLTDAATAVGPSAT